LPITGFGDLRTAGDSDVAFYQPDRLSSAAIDSAAGLLLVRRGILNTAVRNNYIEVDNPQFRFISIIKYFQSQDGGAGIHETAVLSPNAIIGKNCRVGAFAVIHGEIGDNCCIGEFSVIHANTRVGKSVTIGSHSAIGNDGFGFVEFEGAFHYFPQTGRLMIQDHVWIGSHCTINRGALGDTLIGENVKIDDMVHIAHNCQIGKNTLIAGKSALAGSVVVGRNCILGGKVGISDHITIGDGAIIAGATDVIRDVPAGAHVAGSPARSFYRHFRIQALLGRLPELIRRPNPENG